VRAPSSSEVLAVLAVPKAITVYLGSGKKGDRPRTRGRPRKRTVDHYAEILAAHQALRQSFEASVGRQPRSDAELYGAYIASAYDGEAWVIEMRLKTFRNVLGEARTYFRKHPEKCPFTGMDALSTTASNEASESSTTDQIGA